MIGGTSLTACGDEEAARSGSNIVAASANGGKAAIVTGSGSSPSGDSTGRSSQPPPVELQPAGPPAVEPTVQANDQGSSREEAPPATEDEYMHRNKTGERPPG